VHDTASDVHIILLHFLISKYTTCYGAGQIVRYTHKVLIAGTCTVTLNYCKNQKNSVLNTIYTMCTISSPRGSHSKYFNNQAHNTSLMIYTVVGTDHTHRIVALDFDKAQSSWRIYTTLVRNGEHNIIYNEPLQ